MQFERNRLDSFTLWPEENSNEAKKLAKAGLFYVGNASTVQCFSCEQTIVKCGFADQVIQLHTKLSPKCDFVLDKSNNVPIFAQQASLHTSASGQTEKLLQTNATNSTLASTSKLTNPLFTPSMPAATTDTSNKSDYKTWVNFSDLSSEAERLKTFRGWPSTVVEPEDLARNGFFYLRDEDKVKCFFCSGVIWQWEVGDNPAIEHTKHFHNCPFINGYEVRNISLCPSSETPTDETWGGDLAGKYKYEMEVFSKPENGRMTPLRLSLLGISKHGNPIHPNYATYENRLETYRTWPFGKSAIDFPVVPSFLAEAGFYYTGVSDHVRCFHCDGGLRNWEINDNPLLEHARWFGNCGFLYSMEERMLDLQGIIQQDPIVATLPEPPSETQNNETNFNAINRDVTTTALKTTLESLSLEKSSSCKNLSTESSSYFNSFTQSQDMLVEDKNKQLEDMRLCKICMDKELGVVLLPCGHLICCSNCVSTLKDCPLCRKKICGTVKTYFS